MAFSRVDGASPKRTIAFLHGILGAGNNLRSIARRFTQARPEWSAWLVDLRGHGKSPKGALSPSLHAAALDIVDLTSHASVPLHAILGHSFGGKVALEAAAVNRVPSLSHVVVVDSAPGSRRPVAGSDAPLDVMSTLESLPQIFSSKQHFIDALVAEGKPEVLAEWLALSLEKERNQFRFMLDLDEIRVLIYDYYARDLWPVVENPPGGVHVHLVIGDHSDSYSPQDRQKALNIAASNERVTVDILPAGHWVHVDDPDGLLRTLFNRITD